MMGLKRKRSSLPRQLSSYFGFEDEKEEEAEDVGEASIWYSPSPHPSVSKFFLVLFSSVKVYCFTPSFKSDGHLLTWSAFHHGWWMHLKLGQRMQNNLFCLPLCIGIERHVSPCDLYWGNFNKNLLPLQISNSQWPWEHYWGQDFKSLNFKFKLNPQHHRPCEICAP